MTIAIIGAGLAGLACARRLADAGEAPIIFDKGRGIGGRLSTRRADGIGQFDHGAQYITARDPGFLAMLEQAEADGAAARWPQDSETPRFVGLPGMSGLAKHLAQGLSIRQGVEIEGVSQGSTGWTLTPQTEAFNTVISTVPAPQAARLLKDHPLAAQLDAVVMDPCLTLMLAMPHSAPAPFVTRREPDDDMAWIARNSDKPGRDGEVCWVAQASPAWSREHLEKDKPEVADLMLPMVCDRLGADPADALYVAAHRWRYALASAPLGVPFLAADDRTLFIGGDWCLGPRAEAAWLSGTAIADAALEAR